MATVAVLGIGLLGRGFAENLLEKGHQVRVWNRTASKCAAVIEQGAYGASSPADAVAGADRVHLVLAEDTVVDAVMAQFQPSLGSNVPVIDHSTNLPAGVLARAQRCAEAGVRYLHAPVFMGPTSSREATGLMLVSGDRGLIGEVMADLQTMTGRVVDLGDAPDAAAKVKLTGNGMLVMLTATMGDLFAMGRHAGLEPEHVLSLFESFSPTPAGMGRRLLAAEGGPVGFELTMARKDVSLMIEMAGGRDNLTLLPTVLDAIDASIAEGHGAKDFAIFARR